MLRPTASKPRSKTTHGYEEGFPGNEITAMVVASRQLLRCSKYFKHRCHCCSHVPSKLWCDVSFDVLLQALEATKADSQCNHTRRSLLWQRGAMTRQSPEGKRWVQTRTILMLLAPRCQIGPEASLKPAVETIISNAYCGKHSDSRRPFLSAPQGHQWCGEIGELKSVVDLGQFRVDSC